MEAACDTHGMRNADRLFCENIMEWDNLGERGLDWGGGDIRIRLKEVTRVEWINVVQGPYQDYLLTRWQFLQKDLDTWSLNSPSQRNQPARWIFLPCSCNVMSAVDLRLSAVPHAQFLYKEAGKYNFDNQFHFLACSQNCEKRQLVALSVCPSAYNTSPIGFHKIRYLSNFRKYVAKIQV
jgi:hypothetical protein